MEYYWTLFNNSNGSRTTNSVRGHNGSFTPTYAGDSCSWDLPTSTAPASSRPEWTFYTPPPDFQPVIMLHDQQKTAAGHSSSSSTATSSSHYCNPDPHLTCLKLGKRHYFEDLTTPPDAAAGVEAFSITKKGKSCVSTAAAGGPTSPAEALVPRCQVEGCEAVLVNAKDYHRRHKVCQTHAKAPKVVVLGIEQRFCQQCSRFHALAEFDGAKRSCRRRLAGHNERRRKSSQQHNSIANKHYQDIKTMGAAAGRHPRLVNNGECALSLLSPTNYGPWIASTSPDLPARCSAALRELIAENRQLINASQMENFKLGSSWGATTAPENRGHVTLNLMQGPDSAFGLLSAHDHRSSEDNGDGDCSDLWKLPLGY